MGRALCLRSVFSQFCIQRRTHHLHRSRYFLVCLAGHGDDSTYDEIKEVIDGLDVDEQSALVALTWVGRGDFAAGEWSEAFSTALERHNEHTAEYLLGIPLLADLLQTGLDEMGLSCADYEKEHL